MWGRTRASCGQRCGHECPQAREGEGGKQARPQAREGVSATPETRAKPVPAGYKSRSTADFLSRHAQMPPTCTCLRRGAYPDWVPPRGRVNSMVQGWENIDGRLVNSMVQGWVNSMVKGWDAMRGSHAYQRCEHAGYGRIHQSADRLNACMQCAARVPAHRMNSTAAPFPNRAHPRAVPEPRVSRRAPVEACWEAC